MSTPIKGLVRLTDRIDETNAMLLEEADIISNSFAGGNLAQNFLAKRAHVMLKAYFTDSVDTGQPVIAGMAFGNVDEAALKAAMQAQNGDPTDPDNWDDYMLQQKVIWQTLRMFQHEANFEQSSFAHDAVASIDEFITLGGKNGIPFREDVGFQFFVWNAGDAGHGSSIHFRGYIVVEGVFLD